MMKKSLLTALALAVTLSACDNSHPPQTQYVPQPAPQVQQYSQPYQQAPVVVERDTGIGTGTALVGAAAIGTAAYLAGKANAEKQAPQTTNVYRPTTTISAPAPAQPKIQAPVAQAAPAPVAAPKQTFNPVAAKSMTTVTPPKTSAPSYSSSFKPSAVTSKRR
jgi:PBP1b-binding outer membrane lipoprotein LpoB